MFHDSDVDVIYITTPHNTHIEFAREALAGGKHVLCEKSVMLNSRELAEAIALAEEHHVVFAEAMTIWHMPLYKNSGRLLRRGMERFRHSGRCSLFSSISAVTRNII